MLKLSKTPIQKLFITFIPLIILVIGSTIIYYAQKKFYEVLDESLKTQATWSAKEISNMTRSYITTKASALEVIATAETQIFPNNQTQFKKLADAIIKNCPGYRALNWIDPDGVIRWVYPEEENINAKDKKVIDRADVGPYVMKAKVARATRLTHLVATYQGFEAFIFYTPIYEGNVFKGWLNGVVEYKSFFDNLFDTQNYDNSSISIGWKDYKNRIYEYKVNNGDHQYTATTDFNILNQTVQITTYLNHSARIAKQIPFIKFIFTFAYIMIFILTFFAYKIMHNYFSIKNKNQKLKLDNTLINILCHDIATPLTIISEAAIRLREKVPGTFHDLERIIKSSEKQKELLKRIKLFHAADIGKLRIDLKEANLKELVFETLSIYDDQIQSKDIQIEIKIPETTSNIITDKITAVHNVFSNVISNAVKFAPHSSKLLIQTKETAECVVIEFIDEGIGINKGLLQRLFDESYVSSRDGTEGERGTGLGMIQIKSFMTAYKGKIEIISRTIDESPNSHGTCVRLYFQKAAELNKAPQAFA